MPLRGTVNQGCESKHGTIRCQPKPQPFIKTRFVEIVKPIKYFDLTAHRKTGTIQVRKYTADRYAGTSGRVESIPLTDMRNNKWSGRK